MTFTGDFSLAHDGQFLNKIAIAVKKVALMVVGEAASGNVTIDDKRHAFGVQVLNGDANVQLISENTVAQGTLSQVSTDADIEFTISSIWNDLSGVSSVD